jgi:hypothetical protein
MKMRPLGFDFAFQHRAPRWPGWLLLALGVAVVADLARDYRSLRADVARLEARFPALQETADKLLPGRAAANTEEFAAARAVVRRFAAPWKTLFSAIESVQVENVSLLSIEPDAATGQVVITGEGKHYLAVLTYVAQLSAHPAFARVHLSRHEIRDAQPRRPIAFSVVAQWRRI